MKAKGKQKHRRHSADRVANYCGFNFVEGAFVEITGTLAEDYVVQFIDSRTDTVIHEQQISSNHWVRTARQYFTPWLIKVFRLQDHALLFSHHFDCKQQRVYVAIESKALGDTLAWFQLLEAFRQQHQCQLICSTFMNSLFIEHYPDIQFVEPGETVHNLYAMYRVGWFYDASGEIDFNRNVSNFRLQPLGESAADILGLPYTPVPPQLVTTSDARPLNEPYVCIAVHATAQAKYWNNPAGWSELVAYLRQSGYQVVLLSREGLDYMGNHAPAGVTLIPPGPIEHIIHYLRHADLFIGIGSGLSWLSWAAGCKTCLISGFSYPYTEVDGVIRISPDEGLCSGCFNRYRLQADDWTWCPDHQHSARRFECTRSISAQQVIAAIEPYLKYQVPD